MGLVIGTVVAFALVQRERRRANQARPRSPFVPDVAVLFPTTAAERRAFSLVALAAGVCEEIVFRGWLLGALHQMGIGGPALLAVGALAFALPHVYQGAMGTVVTAGLGAAALRGLGFAARADRAPRVHRSALRGEPGATGAMMRHLSPDHGASARG